MIDSVTCQQGVLTSSIPSGRRCDTCDDMITGGPIHPQSAKIRQLMKVLLDIRANTNGERTIVFSQFTSFLDLIEPFLSREGIKFVRCRCHRLTLSLHSR